MDGEINAQERQACLSSRPHCPPVKTADGLGESRPTWRAYVSARSAAEPSVADLDHGGAARPGRRARGEGTRRAMAVPLDLGQQSPSGPRTASTVSAISPPAGTAWGFLGGEGCWPLQEHDGGRSFHVTTPDHALNTVVFSGTGGRSLRLVAGKSGDDREWGVTWTTLTSERLAGRSGPWNGRRRPAVGRGRSVGVNFRSRKTTPSSAAGQTLVYSKPRASFSSPARRGPCDLPAVAGHAGHAPIRGSARPPPRPSRTRRGKRRAKRCRRSTRGA